MKKLLLSLIISLYAFSFNSCTSPDNGSSAEWDVYPLVFRIEVVDNSGNNLLDADVKGNILHQDIKVIFDRIEFPLNVDMNDIYIPSRAYMPYMYGLKLEDGVLKFGEFDGAEDHKDTFLISWGDGSYDDVSYDYDFEWGAGDGVPSSRKTIYLNDEKVESSNIRIVK